MTQAEPSDYPDSYYAATRNRKTRFPPLSATTSADVCVIGGGFSGLATALFLCEQGLDVVLLEARRIGWGASGRNGGQLVSGYGEETETVVAAALGTDAGQRAYRLGYRGIELIADLVERYQIDCDLVWGYLRTAITHRQAVNLRNYAAELQSRWPEMSFDYRENDEVRQWVGSPAYRAVLYTQNEGHLHPLNLALGEAGAIQNLGGRLHEQTPATRIRIGEGNRASTVSTPNGEVRADRLVLCGNAYLDRLEPRLRRTLIPGYSAIIASEPLTSDTRARLLPGNTAVSDLRTVLDYYRFSADGRLLWGGLGHWSGADSDNPAPLLRKRMTKIFAELADVRIDYQWSGRIGISVNVNPQIGRLAANVYYAQAYSGHGVASSHLSGRMICDAIRGQSDEFEMFAALPHRRIPDNGLVHRLARAWGMNSRRLIEWL